MQPPVERVTHQAISNTKAREYVLMMEAQSWSQENEADALVGYGHQTSTLRRMFAKDDPG